MRGRSTPVLSCKVQINRTTSIALLIVLAAIFGLAGWGHLLSLDPDALDAIRLAAATLGAVVLAALGSLLRADRNRDGIPDAFQPPAPAPRTRRQPPLLPVLALAVLLSGCGASAAQIAASAHATVLVATRPERFAFYERAHARCLAASGAFEAYQECMVPARAVQAAADTFRDSLSAVQIMIDAGRQASAAGAIACAVLAAGALARALATAGVPVPEEIETAAAMIGEVRCGE